MIAGGAGRGSEVQKFDRTAASVQSIMLLLAGAALLMPAVFELIQGPGLPSVDDEIVEYDSTVEGLSVAVSVVLVLCYVAGLFFSLKTHKRRLQPDGRRGGSAHGDGEEPWSVRKSLIALAIAGSRSA